MVELKEEFYHAKSCYTISAIITTNGYLTTFCLLSFLERSRLLIILAYILL